MCLRSATDESEWPLTRLDGCASEIQSFDELCPLQWIFVGSLS